MNGTKKPGLEHSISDLASEFAITTRSIRFYEERGLLHPTRRGGVRFYSPGERVKLKLILRGKRLGFSLEESRDIIDMYDHNSGNSKQLQYLLEKITEKREQLKRKRNEINGMLRDLNTAEKSCIEALSKLGPASRQA